MIEPRIACMCSYSRICDVINNRFMMGSSTWRWSVLIAATVTRVLANSTSVYITELADQL